MAYRSPHGKRPTKAEIIILYIYIPNVLSLCTCVIDNEIISTYFISNEGSGLNEKQFNGD